MAVDEEECVECLLLSCRSYTFFYREVGEVRFYVFLREIRWCYFFVSLFLKVAAEPLQPPHIGTFGSIGAIGKPQYALHIFYDQSALILNFVYMMLTFAALLLKTFNLLPVSIVPIVP